MPHFRCVLKRYPHYLFVSSRLRDLRKQQGEAFPSGSVRFEHGVFDTKAQNYSDEEAHAIYQDMVQSPYWNVHIIPLKWYDRDGDEVPEMPLEPQTERAPLAITTAEEDNRTRVRKGA